MRGWDDERGAIAAPAGEQRIATDQLISLRWPAAARGGNAAHGAAAGMAELTDGTLIPMNSLRVAGNTATLTLDRPNDAERQIALAADRAACRRSIPTLR